MPDQLLPNDITTYLADLEHGRRLAPKTVEGYGRVLRQMLQRGVRLDAGEVGEFISKNLDGTRSAATTRNQKRAVIEGFLTFLRNSGKLEDDLTNTLQRAKQPARKRALPTIEDLSKALTHLVYPPHWRQVRDNTLLRLFFHTGLRLEEVRALDLAHFDMEQRVLRRVPRKGGKLIDVILSEPAARAIESWLAVRPIPMAPALFVGASGERLSSRMIEKILEKMGKRAGVHLHPHLLRHLHATELRRRGVNADIIRESMSHSKIATTQLYFHEDEETLRKGVSTLPELQPRKKPDDLRMAG